MRFLTTVLVSMRAKPHSPELELQLISILIGSISETHYSFRRLSADTQILPEDIKNLFNALEKTDITSVDFSENDIDDEGAIVIAEALTINRTLTSLNFDTNFIGLKNDILTFSTQIDISGLLTDTAAISLVQAIQTNRNLKNLILSNNNIKAPMLINIIKAALIDNSTITKLVVGDSVRSIFSVTGELHPLATFIGSIDCRLITPTLLVVYSDKENSNLLKVAFEYHVNNMKFKNNNTNESKEKPEILFSQRAQTSQSQSATTFSEKEGNEPQFQKERNKKSVCRLFCSLM